MNEETLNLVLTVAITAILAFKGTTYYKKLKYKTLFGLLELAVTWVYKTYVQPTKEANGDGKLTTEQKQIAAKMAADKAQEFAKAKGLDLQKELGHEYVDLYIQQLVAKAKAGAIGPKTQS